MSATGLPYPITRNARTIPPWLLAPLFVSLATGTVAQEVIVSTGADETIALLKAENWWGETSRAQGLSAPRLMLTGIDDRWHTVASALPVATKKELFYRLVLPLALYANEMVRDRRARARRILKQHHNGATIASDELAWLAETAALLGALDESSAQPFGKNRADLPEVVDAFLYRLDEIPAGLVLGQAAYESGYGTSRFAARGNALFGQWTFEKTGLVPQGQRQSLGDHRIAAFEWPFDSVRSYYINLSTHPAYEEFRRIRAERRAKGLPLDALALAEGLGRYSERGAAYVDTLKGIITFNRLERADHAVLRDEPMRFLVGADNEAEAASLRVEIAEMRTSGELEATIARMRLD